MFGLVDYRLAKRSILDSFREGALSTTEICDAHPELIRAARNIGAMVEETCDVCGGESLRNVRYVFGDELKGLSGRVVYPDDWATELSSQFDEFRCYVVEVCIDCGWNHLESCFLMGRKYANRKKKLKAAGRLIAD